MRVKIMFILGGTSARTIAEDISKELQQPLIEVTYKRFPDDEFYVRILDDVKGEDVLIIQTTYPDTKIVELLLMQDAVYEAGANEITVALPYFGYSRQDKKFEEGEPISARAIAEHISLHADYVITVDPHKEHLLDFFNVPAYSCSAVVEIAKYLKEKDVDFVLAPDKGAKKRAQQAAGIIGCEYDYMEKTRIDGTTIKIKPKNLDAKNKNVAIIDDIISTGGTMAKSVRELKKQGAKKVSVACTHGLFVGGAKEKLLSAGCDEIISTDTIEDEFSKVKTAPCIAEMFLKISQ
ncbi:MAG: ribose-phosphate diphosphokinase [Candidatus Thermoplasmatota archaeon]|nr:ribose-phosphate diphosphokinase [Candidatus Thermoplasmatota archaeon]